jgi:hypothetical protein
LQFAVFFSFLTAVITLSEAWFHQAIVPQSVRYHLEMEMALAILAGMVAYEAFKRSPRRVAMGGMVLLAVLLIAPLRISRHYARGALIRSVDITKTSEWKTADWLNRNWTGERVMLPGSSAYWLTAFSDTPQLGGGFAQGITDLVLTAATFGIETHTGGNWAEWSVLWLKALGMGAVGVSGPGSTEVYRDFVDPKLFEGVLEPLWRDGGDVLYRVGKPHLSLARVVPRGALVARTPVSAADVDPLREYVRALEDPSMPQAAFQWTSAHTAKIVADFGAQQVVSLQMAWHPGWHAREGGKDIPVLRDALGLVTIFPPHDGPSTIDLVYDGGLEMRAAKWICGLTALTLLAVAGRGILKKSW